MCTERPCREGMGAETLNKRSSVEWWMATPDRTIQRMAHAWPTTTTELGFSQETEN